MRLTASTPEAPRPAGPYSQVARVGDVIAAAGQVGRLPDGTLVEGVDGQARQALRNVLAVLRAGGAEEGDIVSVRVFLTDPADFDAVNAAFVEMLQAPYPARTTVFVGLRPGLLVEIDALAVVTTPSAT